MAAPKRKNRGVLKRIPYPTAGWTRMISIILSAVLVWIFFSRPGDILTLLEQQGNGIMALLLWGVAIGLIHGIGFVLVHPFWRLMFHPVIGWVCLLYGIGMTLG